MKINIISIIITLGINIGLVAQNLSIVEKKVPSKNTIIDAWVIDVGKDPGYAKDTFSKFVKEEFDLKAKNDGKLIIAVTEASIPAVSVKHGDLRATLYSEDTTTMMAISFIKGYDIYVNSEEFPEEMAALRSLTRDYLKFHYEDYYTSLVNKNEKAFGDLRRKVEQADKEIVSLRKSNSKLEKKMIKEDDEAKKLDMKNKIAQNELKIKNLEVAIPGYKNEVIAIRGKVDQNKTLLNTLESRIKKAEEEQIADQN